MVKVVLTTKIDPTYDDLPEDRYHFPRTYLNTIQQAIGDWAVYYEPRRASGDLSSRGGRQAYFAAARVTRLEKDPSSADRFYVYVSDFIEFERDVPFHEGNHYFESALQKEDGSTNRGMFGRAVRSVSDAEYDLILKAGFAPLLSSRAETESVHVGPGLMESPISFSRPFVEQVVTRPFRERAFARNVKLAYADTCAVTGIKIINGGGRSEVQAAHIRPVAAHGPDSVRNGIALSGTFHWMFDRGLIAIDDDYSILIAKDRVPDTIAHLVRTSGRIDVPSKLDLRPHPQFLRFHRDEYFKG